MIARGRLTLWSSESTSEITLVLVFTADFLIIFSDMSSLFPVFASSPYLHNFNYLFYRVLVAKSFWKLLSPSFILSDFNYPLFELGVIPLEKGSYFLFTAGNYP